MAVTITEGTPNTTGAATFNVSIPAHSAGDLLVLLVAKNQGTSSTPSISTAGWNTEVRIPNASASNHVLVGWKSGDGSESSVTVANMSGGTLIGKVYRVQGAKTTSPIVGTSDTEQSTGTAASSKTLDVGTAASGQAGFSVICWASSTSAPSVTNGYTLDETSTLYGLAYKVLNSTDDSIDWSWTTNRNWRVALVVFDELPTTTVTTSTVATTAAVPTTTETATCTYITTTVAGVLAQPAVTVKASCTITAGAVYTWASVNSGTPWILVQDWSYAGSGGQTTVGTSSNHFNAILPLHIMAVVSAIAESGTTAPTITPPSGWTQIIYQSRTSPYMTVGVWVRRIEAGVRTVDTQFTADMSCRMDASMWDILQSQAYSTVTGNVSSYNSASVLTAPALEDGPDGNTFFLAGFVTDIDGWTFSSTPVADWATEYSAFSTNKLITAYQFANSTYDHTTPSWTPNSGSHSGLVFHTKFQFNPVVTTGTPTPAVVSTVGGVPSPTITGSGTVVTTTVATVGGVGSSSVVTATDATATPATVECLASVPAPTLSSSVTLTPSSVAITTGGTVASDTWYIVTSNALGTETWRASSTGTVATSTRTPDVVAGVLAVPAPTITSVPNNITPAAVNGVSTVPAPTITAVVTITPATVATAFAQPAVTVSVVANSSHTTTTVATVAAVDSVTVTASGTIAASVVATIGTVESVTVTTASTTTVEPTTVATVGAVDTVTPFSSATVSAGVSTSLAVPAPTITASGTVETTTVATLAAQPEVIPSIGINAETTTTTVATVSTVPTTTETSTAVLTPSTVATSLTPGTHSLVVQSVAYLLHVATTTTVPSITRTTTATVTPASVATARAVPSSTPRISSTASPSVVTSSTAVGSISISSVEDAVVEPSTVATSLATTGHVIVTEPVLTPSTVAGVAGVGLSAPAVVVNATAVITTVVSDSSVPVVALTASDRPTANTVVTSTAIDVTVRASALVALATVATSVAPQAPSVNTLSIFPRAQTVSAVPAVSLSIDAVVRPSTVATSAAGIVSAPGSSVSLILTTVVSVAGIAAPALSSSGTPKPKAVNTQAAVPTTYRASTYQPVSPATVASWVAVPAHAPVRARHFHPRRDLYPHVRDREDWAVTHQQRFHREALNQLGEYSIFVLLWNKDDFDEGLVQRCSTCWKTTGRTAEVYGQGNRSKCQSCYGTTFEGGFRAKIIRQALWDITPEVLREETTRGQVTTRSASIQSTADFRMNSGDWIIRADGSRWQVQSVGANLLHTGFEMTTYGESAMGWNYGTVVEESPASPAWLVPPLTKAEIRTLLDVSRIQFEKNYAAAEVVRGALL